MSRSFPYQVAVFIDAQPEVGERVYYGEHGWFPQVALKRRFDVEGIDEAELVSRLGAFLQGEVPFEISLKDAVKSAHIPVRIIEVARDEQLTSFHKRLISALGKDIVSRFPEREENHYEPHVTIEYKNEIVVDPAQFVDRTIPVTSVWLLKDVKDQNSTALVQFQLKSTRDKTST